MKILLDESLPRQIRIHFTGHEVSTVQEMGWAGTRNGELISLAQQSFDVFVTADQNLEFQQNLSDAQLSILVLAAPTNRIDDLLPFMADILEALSDISPGQLIRFSK